MTYGQLLPVEEAFLLFLKMRIRFLLRGITFLLALPIAVLCKGEVAGTLQLEKEIPLPGVEGRIDHFSADVPRQRLFVAALGNGSVEILDIRQGERTAEIKGLQEPQGVYYDSTTGVATGGDGKLRVYDGKAFCWMQGACPAGRSRHRFWANRHHIGHSR